MAVENSGSTTRVSQVNHWGSVRLRRARQGRRAAARAGAALPDTALCRRIRVAHPRTRARPLNRDVTDLKSTPSDRPVRNAPRLAPGLRH